MCLLDRIRDSFSCDGAYVKEMDFGLFGSTPFDELWMYIERSEFKKPDERAHGENGDNLTGMLMNGIK